MINQRIFTTFIILILMFSQATFFGEDDWVSLIFIAITTVIIFKTLLKLQTGNKKALRANAKKGSFLYNFLSGERTPFLILFSFSASLISSIIMVLILKGITFNHGYWGLFFVIGIISFTIFSFITDENASSAVVADNLQEDVSSHANNMLQIIFTAIALNFALSFILSAHDTMSLLSSHISIANFENIALEHAVDKLEGNHYTRLMINLYLLLDAFKLALTTQIIDILVPNMDERLDWFYVFYIVVFILNMMKLFFFSFAFVLLQRGMIPYVKMLRNFIKTYIILPISCRLKRESIKAVVIKSSNVIKFYLIKKIKGKRSDNEKS